MAQNRKAIHRLAAAAGYSYEEAKFVVYVTMLNLPQAESLMIDMVDAIARKLNVSARPPSPAADRAGDRNVRPRAG
jgi:uncharacterized membrane protein